MRATHEAIRIQYRLVEADVLHYCSEGLASDWLKLARAQMRSLLLLLVLVCLFVWICLHARGFRTGGLAMATIMGVVVVFGWARLAQFKGRVFRITHQMGFPRQICLVLSREGITEEPDRARFGATQTFPWSDILAISRVNNLTVIHLQPAGSILIVPDSAFVTPESREEFEAALKTFRSGSE